MNDEYYKRILIAEFQKLLELIRQRDTLEVQIAKGEEFILATTNMLSDDERDKFRKELDDVTQRGQIRDASLTNAIRIVLQGTKGFLTVTQVRDRLKDSGFDFSGYASNPLASVSTTLRRMKPEDVETDEIQGVACYRWKQRKSVFTVGSPIVGAPIVGGVVPGELPGLDSSFFKPSGRTNKK